MKRTLITLAVLLCLSLGTLTGIHLWVNAARDQVALTETVLAGDPAAAAGVTVTCRTQDRAGHLNWETRFTPGGEPETDFSFSYKGTEGTTFGWTGARLEGEFQFGMSGSIDLDSPLYHEEDQLMLRLAKVVADNTGDGTTRTETLLLTDFCKTWPISFHAQYRYTAGEYYSETSGELARYFYLPVSPEQRVEVAVTKAASGEVTEIDIDYGPDCPNLWCDSVVTEDGAYLIARAETESGEDLFQLPGGQGIHFVPMGETNREGVFTGYVFDPANLRLFYPTDAYTLALSVSEDESNLLLYTREGGKLVLTVIDRAGGETLQRLELMDLGEDDWFGGTIDCGPLHLAVPSSGEFRLLRESRSGVEIVLSGFLDREDEVHWDLTGLNREPVLAWDGERLVWGAPSDYGCMLTLSVWTAGGLQFLAQYQTGPARDPISRQGYMAYHASDTEPLAFAFS